MTAKKPYEPPTYGVRNLAIERRIAGKPPASGAIEDDGGEKNAEVPEDKMVSAPENKAAAKRKAK